jgi:hypothetical protein
VLGTLLPGAAHLQNFHPLVVHFPLALLTDAVLLYFLAGLSGRESLAWTGLWFLGLGTLGGAVAVGSSPAPYRGTAAWPRILRTRPVGPARRDDEAITTALSSLST